MFRVCFAPDGRSLFTGSQDGLVHRWSVPSRPIKEHSWHYPTGLSSMALTASGERFTGLSNGAVSLGLTRDFGQMSVLPELGANNMSLRVAPDGETLLV